MLGKHVADDHRILHPGLQKTCSEILVLRFTTHEADSRMILLFLPSLFRCIGQPDLNYLKTIHSKDLLLLHEAENPPFRIIDWWRDCQTTTSPQPLATLTWVLRRKWVILSSHLFSRSFSLRQHGELSLLPLRWKEERKHFWNKVTTTNIYNCIVLMQTLFIAAIKYLLITWTTHMIRLFTLSIVTMITFPNSLLLVQSLSTKHSLPSHTYVLPHNRLSPGLIHFGPRSFKSPTYFGLIKYLIRLNSLSQSSSKCELMASFNELVWPKN